MSSRTRTRQTTTGHTIGRRAAVSVVAALLLFGGPSVAVAMAADSVRSASTTADDGTIPDGGTTPDDGTVPDDGTTPDDGASSGDDTGTDDGSGADQGAGDSSTSVTLDDAVLAWGINTEVSSGAYFGGCNFLSAGAAGNTGSSRVWTQADGFYKAKDGNVSIRKAGAVSGWVTPTWATKCLQPDGKTAVTTATSTQSQVVVSGGKGTVDPTTGTASITWTGSFAVVFYGGLTYWTATNPTLTVAADGTGTLKATGGGYGADRVDTSKWTKLDPTPITLATFTGVKLTDKGLTATPSYLGVAVTGVGQTEKTSENAKYWGSFPQDFMNFQQLTGQSTYWLASGGSGDARKLPTPVTVSYDAADQVEVTPTPTPTSSAPAAPTNKVTKRPSATPTVTVTAAPTATPTATVTAAPTAAATSVTAPQAVAPAAPPVTTATGNDVVAQGPVGTTHAIEAVAAPVATPAPDDARHLTTREVWLLGGALWLGAGAVLVGLPRAGSRRR